MATLRALEAREATGKGINPAFSPCRFHGCMSLHYVAFFFQREEAETRELATTP